MVRTENNRIAYRTNPVSLPDALKPGETAQVAMAKVQLQDQAQLRSFRLVVESAQVLAQ